MRWRKLGCVFTGDGRHEWMASHAANPVAEPRGGDEFRIYFGCRDRDNRAHVAYVDIELADEVRLVQVGDEPVVAPGPPGVFDDSGASMGCLVRDGERCLLYYVGWNLGVTVPWRNSIGLAVRERPDGPFVKFAPAPLLDRCAVDPYTLSYPHVLREDGVWRMWYGSNLTWGRTEEEMRHVIKYAESSDGLHWRRTALVALGLQGPDACAVCRPWVVKEGAGYRMWYCHRGRAYRIACATSADGVTWQRADDVPSPDVSPDGWDSDMVAYPSLFEHRDRQYMLYNGNRYGKTGFGVAVAAA